MSDEALDLARARAMARQRQMRMQVAPAQSADPVTIGGNQYTAEQADFIRSIQAQPNVELPASQPVSLGGMATAAKENIMGDDDPTTFNTGEKIGQMINNAGEAMTFGVVGDEATAAAASLMGGDYDESLKRSRDSQANFREQHPGLSVASEVAPAFLPGIGAARAAQGATKLGRAGYGALVGGAGGATLGFMEGEGGFEDRATKAAITGALGTAFGAAAPKVMDSIAALPRSLQRVFSRSARRPTVENLRAAKNAAYRAVDESGEAFGGDTMTALSQRVQAIFDESNYDEVADTASGAVLRILRGKEGRDTTIGQLDRVRQNLWKRFATAGDQPQILDAIGAIDDVMEEAAGASQLMAAARAANARFAKSELLEDAFRRATDNTAVSGSGGNIANNYTRAVKNILHNPRKMRFFNADEEALMRGFVRMADEGGPAFRRLVGKMSPSGNGLMMTLHAVGGMASGGATLPLMVAGGVAKKSADNAVLRAGGALQDVFSGFTQAPPAINQLSRAGGATVSGAVPPLEDAVDIGQNTLARAPR